ncbi:MAG: hypothetical protein ACRC8S_17225 [Fimbriiglobus sp.]
MAKVILDIEECRPGILPPVCVKCGEHADETKAVHYSWQPDWIGFCFLFGAAGILPFIILSMVLKKRAIIHWPVCHEHNNFWGWVQVFIGSAISLCAGLLVVGILLSVAGNPVFESLGLALCGGSVVGFVVSVIIYAVWSKRLIHASYITDRKATMLKVHPQFVAALEEDRDSDERAYHAERRRAQVRQHNYNDDEFER